MEGFAQAEILVRNEAHGRGSRGSCGAFEETKGKSREKRGFDPVGDGSSAVGRGRLARDLRRRLFYILGDGYTRSERAIE